jgi:hypothetical protein
VINLKVENVKITIEGAKIPYPQVQEVIGELGGTVHSVDEVVADKMIVEDAVTPQG